MLPFKIGSRREWVALAAFAAIGLSVFIWKADSVYPEANVRLKLSRSQIVELGRAFCAGQGLELQGRHLGVAFWEDGDGVAYLQKQMPLQKVQELADPERPVWVPLWNWGLRWFKPLSKDEVWVSFTPNGQLKYFVHEQPEDAPGASIPREKAKVIALDFLRKNAQFDAKDWTLIEESSDDKPKRRDHNFTWKRNEPNFGEAHLRLWVRIDGDKPSGFDYFLKVPEKFTRDYATERSRGELVTTIMWSVLDLFLILGAGLFIIHFRSGEADWRMGLLLFALYAASQAIEGVNGWPGRMMGYDTTQPFMAFLYNNFLYPIVYDLPIQGLTALTFGAGVGMALLAQRKKWLEGLRELSRGELGHSSWPAAVARGYLLVGFYLGAQVLIYLFGWRYMGVWFPGRNALGGILGAWIPALSPLTSALYAAPFEEGIFRLAAFVIVLRWTKRPWLAVLLPCMVDAFLHSNYEVFPWYFRGLELTIIFSFFAWVLHRWGLLTIMITHGLADIILTAYPFFKSGQAGWTAQGVFAIAAPLAIALIGWLAAKKRAVQEPEIPALNREICVELIRRALAADSVMHIDDFLKEHGAQALTPAERALFVLREMLGETVELRAKPGGGVIVRVHKTSNSAAKSLAMRFGKKLLAVAAIEDGRGYFFDVPA